MNHRTDRLRRRLETYRQLKQWDAIAATIHELLRQAPGDVALWLELSTAHSMLDNYRAAREAAISAIGSLAHDAAQTATVVARLRAFNLSREMILLVDRPEIASCDQPQILSSLAAMMSSINQQDRALDLLDRALRIDPDFPPVLVNRGHVLMYYGRGGDATRDLERCIARAPELARAHWILSRIDAQSAGHNHVERLRSRLRVATSDDDRVFLGFALFKELDDLGQVDAAWEALRTASATKRKRVRYESAETRQLVDALISQVRDVTAQGAATREGPQPIFIVGLHRSGTTLLERILGGHPDVQNTGELYDFTSQLRLAANHHCRGALDKTIVDRSHGFDYALIGEGYLQATSWRSRGKPWFTDKLPTNALNLGFILRALPNARVLNLVRNPMATGFSSLKELFSDACGYSYDMQETADYFAQHHRLMAHWRSIAGDRFLDVGYADLVNDPEHEAGRILSFCGIENRADFDARNLSGRHEAVATASSQQVQMAIHTSSVSGWRRYAQQLEPLRAALQRNGLLPAGDKP